MAANRKFLFASAVFIFLIFTPLQNSFAKIYKWEDLTQSFKKEIRVGKGAKFTVEVSVPELILKNYIELPINISHRGIKNDRYKGLLTINDQSEKDGYLFKSDQQIILLNTQDLKAGSNKLHIRISPTGSLSWQTDVVVVERLRFDFSKMKDVMAHIDKKQATAKAAIKTPTSPVQELKKDTTPPKIFITSHDISRGIRPLQNQKKVRISGMAYDDNGIVEITVNNKDATFDEAGNFETDVYLKMGKNRIVVNAMDIYENRARKEFTIARVASQTPSKAKIVKTAMVNYYALVIGNNDYKYLKKLETAKNDAMKVAETLKLRYGFETNLLLDADRDAILDAINDFRRILKQDDQFLIYYAGHGSFDKTVSKAYWLPVDAQRNNDKNWIIVDTITSNLKRISANHVLIVADSCYSGTFTRTNSLTKLESAQKRRIYLKKMQAKKSRTLLASGGNEPVSDIGGEGHSVFAKAFLASLTNMDLNEFTAEELYIQYIKKMVSGSADQTPEYNIIRNSGHEGGGFVFRRKLASVEHE